MATEDASLKPLKSDATIITARRKRLINTIAADISSMKRAILGNETSIANFQTRGSGDAEYNSIRIENSSKNIEELRARIVRAEQKIQNVENGLFDSEIQQDHQRVKDLEAQKLEKIRLLTESENACKEVGKSSSKAFYEIERNSKYMERTLEKEAAKYWDVCMTLPPNILKNIESTPCNRGYRYRGVCFYGKRPEQKPDMIFQKTHDGTLIEEITDTLITKYLKPFNGGNKTVISRVRREISPGLGAPAKLTNL